MNDAARLIADWKTHLESRGGEIAANARPWAGVVECFLLWASTKGYDVSSYLTGKDWDAQHMAAESVGDVDPVANGERGKSRATVSKSDL
jgi:hypothetical protein